MLTTVVLTASDTYLRSSEAALLDPERVDEFIAMHHLVVLVYSLIILRQFLHRRRNPECVSHYSLEPEAI